MAASADRAQTFILLRDQRSNVTSFQATWLPAAQSVAAARASGVSPTSSSSSSSFSSGPGSVGFRGDRYKTELCRTYEEMGTCRYEDRCQFAHGATELRAVSRHPRYKTELCRTFHTSGFCPYGYRCHFIHAKQVPVQGQVKSQCRHQPRAGPTIDQVCLTLALLCCQGYGASCQAVCSSRALLNLLDGVPLETRAPSAAQDRDVFSGMTSFDATRVFCPARSSVSGSSSLSSPCSPDSVVPVPRLWSLADAQSGRLN